MHKPGSWTNRVVSTAKQGCWRSTLDTKLKYQQACDTHSRQGHGRQDAPAIASERRQFASRRVVSAVVDSLTAASEQERNEASSLNKASSPAGQGPSHMTCFLIHQGDSTHSWCARIVTAGGTVGAVITAAANSCARHGTIGNLSRAPHRQPCMRLCPVQRELRAGSPRAALRLEMLFPPKCRNVLGAFGESSIRNRRQPEGAMFSVKVVRRNSRAGVVSRLNSAAAMEILTARRGLCACWPAKLNK